MTKGSVFSWIILLLAVVQFTTSLQAKKVVKKKQEMPILMDIGFLKGQFPDNGKTPASLTLDVRFSTEAFYKLSYNNAALTNGSFRKGDNRIVLPTGHLFEAAGVYVFVLETQAGNYRFKYEITIDIHFLNQPQTGTPGPSAVNRRISLESSPPLQYQLEMYIRGHLAAKSRKRIYQAISEKTKQKIRAAMKSKFKSPRDPDHPGSVSIPKLKMSIMAPPFTTLYRLLTKKKTPPEPKSRQISFSFRKDEANGIQKKIDARLELKYKVIK
jgi:hypothetical protein